MVDNGHEHLHLLCDISELMSLAGDTDNIDSFMQRAVQMVATHLNADVGSIYLLDENTEVLTLRATIGLNPESVGQIKMKVGEGLVGTTLAQMAPVCEGLAGLNPRFKYFEQAHEDRYNSFLSVPISRGTEKIGVLVVQHERETFFNPADVMALRAIASQLAGTVANARLMMALHEEVSAADASTVLESLQFVKGEATVRGYALGPSVRLRSSAGLLVEIPDQAFKGTLEDFRHAVEETQSQLRALQTQLVKRLPESAALIFSAHLMILQDPSFVDEIVRLIDNGQRASVAIRTVADRIMDLLAKSPSAYIREKAQDIEDLARRVLFNLRKDHGREASPVESGIVIASQLYPSEILKLAVESVGGIILVSGGMTSHVAILARSLKIPMIIAKRRELLRVPDGTPVLMDADVGSIYVNPSEHVRDQFSKRNHSRDSTSAKINAMCEMTHTGDGTRVQLLANINLLSELDLARDLKAEGIGLYRSEFPFIVRSVFPSEEEQRLVYSRLFEKMEGSQINIRTLDIGGDKVLPYLNIPEEANPELGLRSIRFSLKYRDVFDLQIRAILRAGAKAEQLGIMFPMISSIDDFELAKEAVLEALQALKKERLPHHPNPDLGVMIELPAIVNIIDELAEVADFFSIGTNDFVQYMLAVDRTNENVAEYYQPFHPAVLRSLARIVQAVNDRQKPLSICGEVAHHEDFVPFLLGIGVRRLSVDPQFLPVIQSAIGDLILSDTESYAKELLAAPTIAQINQTRDTWLSRGW